MLSIKKNNKPFVVYGTGKPLRQFIYSVDLAKLIMIVLNNYQETTPIILSTNKEDEVSIKYVAELIHTLFENKNPILFDESFSDNNKLKKLIKDFNFTSINKGLRNTIEWFIQNYTNNIRL